MDPLHSLPLEHPDYHGDSPTGRCASSFTWMSDFERRGVTHLFPIGSGAPLVTDGADDIVSRDQCSSVNRDDAAQVLDLNLHRLAQAPAVLDLKLGERLAQLKEGTRLLQLGYVRLGDFCREELGISPRLASELVRTSRELERFPALKHSFLSGHVNRSTLRHILPVVTADTEAEWVGKAKALTVREIEVEARKVNSQGRGAGDESAATACQATDGSDDTPGEVISFRASREFAWKWDTAREFFHRLEGANCSPAAFVEALCAEYLSGPSSPHPPANISPSPAILAEVSHPPEGEGRQDAITAKTPPGHEGRPGDRTREKAEWNEVHQSLEELSNRWEFLSHDPVHVEAHIKNAEEESAHAIVQGCREIMALRQEVQFFTARLLRTVNQLSLYRDMMFSSLGHYAIERLGISRRSAYELVWLGRRFIELPELGEAFRRGRLTQRQVSLIAGIADEKTVGAWIAYAWRIPVLVLQAEHERVRRLLETDENLPWKTLLVPGCIPEESIPVQKTGMPGDGACRVTGVQVCAAREHNAVTSPARISFSLPSDLKPLWNDALSRFLATPGSACISPGSLQCEEMSDMCRGEGTWNELLPRFLEELVDHFLVTWLTLTGKERHHRVLVRDGFRCMVPGCSSRRNLHVHHIIFRSHGGSDDDSNLATICLGHHIHGVHEGRIIIEGEAPDRLTIHLGVERGQEPFAVWHGGERVVHSA